MVLAEVATWPDVALVFATLVGMSLFFLVLWLITRD